MTTAQINYALSNPDGSRRDAYDNGFQPLPAGVRRHKIN